MRRMKYKNFKGEIDFEICLVLNVDIGVSIHIMYCWEMHQIKRVVKIAIT